MGATRTRVAGPDPRFVILELDARGEIDAHAAMCLRQALRARTSVDDAPVTVDLRDLTAVDETAVAQIGEADAACREHGAELAPRPRRATARVDGARAGMRRLWASRPRSS